MAGLSGTVVGARTDRLVAILEAEEERDERTLGRIFGEELPSGLVLGETVAPEVNDAQP